MTTITALSSARRSNKTTSVVWQVPANIQGDFAFALDLLLADLIDPTKSASVALIDETGQTLAGFTWVGGPNLDKFGRPVGNPRITFAAADIAGKEVRLVVTPNKAITFGGILEVA
jgi:hypothetical protein